LKNKGRKENKERKRRKIYLLMGWEENEENYCKEYE